MDVNRHITPAMIARKFRPAIDETARYYNAVMHETTGHRPFSMIHRHEALDAIRSLMPFDVDIGTLTPVDLKTIPDFNGELDWPLTLLNQALTLLREASRHSFFKQRNEAIVETVRQLEKLDTWRTPELTVEVRRDNPNRASVNLVDALSRYFAQVGRFGDWSIVILGDGTIHAYRPRYSENHSAFTLNQSEGQTLFIRETETWILASELETYCAEQAEKLDLEVKEMKLQEIERHAIAETAIARVEGRAENLRDRIAMAVKARKALARNIGRAVGEHHGMASDPHQIDFASATGPRR